MIKMLIRDNYCKLSSSEMVSGAPARCKLPKSFIISNIGHCSCFLELRKMFVSFLMRVGDWIFIALLIVWAFFFFFFKSITSQVIQISDQISQWGEFCHTSKRDGDKKNSLDTSRTNFWLSCKILSC